jgi:hypothetical protein
VQREAVVAAVGQGFVARVGVARYRQRRDAAARNAHQRTVVGIHIGQQGAEVDVAGHYRIAAAHLAHAVGGDAFQLQRARVFGQRGAFNINYHRVAYGESWRSAAAQRNDDATHYAAPLALHHEGAGAAGHVAARRIRNDEAHNLVRARKLA